MRKRPYLSTLLLLLAALVLSVAVGSVSIPLADLAKMLASKLTGGWIASTWANNLEVIVFQLRIPRTVMVMITGAALGGSGAAYQGLFRNPLADPYLIGVASGAGLGAVLAMTFQPERTTTALLMVPLAAFIAALITVAVVYAMARVGKTIPATQLILAGVAVSAFATAVTSFLMLRSTGELRRALVWQMGGAAMSGWDPVLAVLPFIALGVGVLLTLGHSLNVLQFGDEQAAQLGLPVDRVRIITIAAASLTTAAAVSFSGIIGFVGLVVPHVVRLIWGADYRRVIPLSVIGGGALLLCADVLARILLAPQEIPTGIITSLIGAPFFLWLLRRSRRQNLM